jgi:hypothetical protein
MTEEEAAAYVEATAGLLGFTLDAAQLARVAAVFARNADMAALLTDFELPEAAEPAPQFRP